MKRALAISAGTLAGLAAVLALNPDPAVSTVSASAATSAGSTSDGSTSSGGATTDGSTSDGSTSSGGSSSSSASGTYTGDLVDIGHNYGDIQVQITVSSGQITDITTTAVPQNDHRSAQISDYAVPERVAGAQAQSADIAASGATFTSMGFAESLRSAMVQAGLA
jgi:uncharacterized protein with FMN-binding domain